MTRSGASWAMSEGVLKRDPHPTLEKVLLPPSEGARLRAVVLFPGPYRVGMSCLGVHLLYRLVNSTPGWRCERAFVEGPGAPRAVESRRFISDFDLILASVPFEADYPRLARAIGAAGLTARARERNEREPLLVVGGLAPTANPEPLARVADAVLLGEAEVAIPLLLSLLEAGASRSALLERIAGEVPGAYVPSLYEDREEGGFLLAALPQGTRILPVVLPEVAEPASTCVLTPETEFSEMFLVEVMRGCPGRCVFCLASHHTAPVRRVGFAQAWRAVEQGLAFTRRVGLVGLSAGEHPDATRLVEAVARAGGEVGFSSLSIRALSGVLLEALARAGTRSVTIAPEAGTPEERARLGKPAADEEIVEGCRLAVRAGVQRVKAYFVLGLPRPVDVDAIVSLCKTCLAAMRAENPAAELSVSASVFAPKPGTPLEREPVAGAARLRSEVGALASGLAGLGVRLEAGTRREAVGQALCGRGDRRLAEALALVAEGVPWRAALARAGVDARAAAGRFSQEAPLPWAPFTPVPADVLDAGRERYLG